MLQNQITVEDLTFPETMHIEKALEAIVGVQRATAEAGVHRVVVEHEESVLRETLRAAVSAAGLHPGAAAPEPDIRH